MMDEVEAAEHWPHNDALTQPLQLSYPQLAEKVARRERRYDLYVDVPAIIIVFIILWLLWNSRLRVGAPPLA
jgi:hypothetical protein